MLQLENQTPFKASIALLPDRAGIDTLYLVIKATVTLKPKLSLAKEQVPPTLADEYYGDPAGSSLKAATEMHIGKPGTDVLLVGQAWAPDQRPVTRMQVGMTVAGRRKVLQVSGDRVWRGGKPGAPQPFVSMPLVWEHAFGGTHRLKDSILAEERNPVGRGYSGKRSAAEMEGEPVPNVEDAATPLQQVGGTAVPACFAPVAPAWLPRRGHAGTYDARWQRSRAPYLPADFDSRFFQCAAPEFSFDRYLQGGEPVEVTGVAADGPISFVIPPANLTVAVTIAGSPQHPLVNLETLLIEPDENRACFTWRAAQPCDRQALKVEKIVISRTAGGSNA